MLMDGFRRQAEPPPPSGSFWPQSLEPQHPGLQPPELQPPPLPPRRRRWYRRPGIILAILFGALFLWLAVTAPLSKSLHPIAPPGIVLLSADGRPIARRGAITDQPMSVTELHDQVPNAIVAIEDRRFYNHNRFNQL